MSLDLTQDPQYTGGAKVEARPTVPTASLNPNETFGFGDAGYVMDLITAMLKDSTYGVRVLAAGKASTTSVAALLARVEALENGAPPVVTNKVLIEGDSLSADQAHGGFAGNYPSQVQTLLAGNAAYVGFTNFAVAGESIGGVMDSSGQKTAVVAAKGSTGQTILGLLAGINDLQSMAVPSYAYSLYKALVNYYVGQGIKVVAFTLTTSRAAGLADHPEFWTRLQQFNNLVRGGFNDGTLLATVLLDLQTVPALAGYDAPLNTTYFQGDGIHYKAAGAALIAELFVRALPYALAGTRKVVNGTGESNTAPILPVDSGEAPFITPTFDLLVGAAYASGTVTRTTSPNGLFDAGTVNTTAVRAPGAAARFGFAYGGAANRVVAIILDERTAFVPTGNARYAAYVINGGGSIGKYAVHYQGDAGTATTYSARPGYEPMLEIGTDNVLKLVETNDRVTFTTVYTWPGTYAGELRMHTAIYDNGVMPGLVSQNIQ